MKPEIPLSGGEEHDMLTRWRKMLHHRPGRAKAAKNGYWKRVRRWIRNKMKEGE